MTDKKGRKRQTCGETRQTIESDSRETAREKMIRFLSSDFSVSRRRTRVDRPKFQLLLAVIIKVGAQGEGATN